MSVQASILEQPLPEKMADKLSQLLEQLWRPKPSRYGFQVNGVLFEVHSQPEKDGVRLTLEADIGFMPFTAESAEKRRELRALLDHLEKLDFATFRLAKTGEIKLNAHLDILVGNDPVLSFTGIIVFVHKITPYVRLFGKVL